MLALTLPRRKLYGISLKKAFLITLYVAFSGLLGTNIMYFIENGIWGGTSFFGAVLFIPIFLLPSPRIFHIPVAKITDYIAAPGLAMFVVNKLNCYVAGCCGGKVIGYTVEGIPIYFPSQLAEMVCAVIIVCVSLCLERKKFAKGRIYSICLIIYGISRYILNYFRWEQDEFALGMPPGNLWSIVAIVIGIIWLVLDQKRKNQAEDIGIPSEKRISAETGMGDV